MNYIVEYHIKGYSELGVRSFFTLDSAIRFIKYNDFITSYEVYKINKLKVDLNLNL